MSSKYDFHPDGTQPELGEIFVFGSNLAGRNGAGAAKAAMWHFGAKYGVGSGPTGRSYAIPTKGARLEVLSLNEIAAHVEAFKAYAASSEATFFVTRVGCGLAGYSDAQIAPMFRGATTNCVFPEEWRPFLDDGDKA